MRFFRGGSGGSGDEPVEERALRLARAERSQQLVEAGGIPLEAEERIRRQSSQGGVWTSDLSVDELAALRGAGFRPLAQVLGSSLYRLGWISTGLGGGLGGPGWGGMYGWGAAQPRENQLLTQGLYEARSRAINRLLQEARGLGADGVVGVRLTIQHWDWAQGMSEFTVLGTAVRRIDGPPPGEPFTSTLSGQDLARLMSAGHFPLRLVMGASAQQAVAFFGAALGGGGYSAWVNSEIQPFSQAMHQAQTFSQRRLADNAAEAGAEGVVGVSFVSNVVEYGTGSERVLGRIVEWVILGTAVVRQPAPPSPAAPRMVVHLNSGGNQIVGPG